MKVDFGKAAADYGRYRAGFPDEFYDRLIDGGIVSPPCAALDLGTGTGTLARGLALRGCEVTGLDPSANMLAEAKRIDAGLGLQMRYVEGRAEQLPFGDSSFDLVTAGQCWHWFEREAAAMEGRRVLKPGGRIVLAHFDWIPLPGNVVHATEELIMKHNPQWKMAGGSGIHPNEFADLAIAGFTQIQAFAFDVGAPYTHAAWRGRIRASAGVEASLSPKKVAAFDAELANLLAAQYPGDPLCVPHRVWAVTAVSP
jgi:SAM-dependent methyltransferase